MSKRFSDDRRSTGSGWSLRRKAFTSPGAWLTWGGLALLLATAPVYLHGQVSGAAGAGDPALIDAGRTVFSLNCANEFCHGPRGGGNFMGEANGQKLTDDLWFYGDGSYESIVEIVSKGLPGSAMEPWATKLGEERIRQVAAFVKQLSAKP